jgi:hypothetical protein
MALDVKYLQVLVHFPADAGGFFWHHRLLLKKLGAGSWVCLSPDLELERIDLTVQAHVVLDRASPIPAPQAAAAYVFDPVPRAELDALVRRAEAMAMILDENDPAELAALGWYVSDSVHAHFGRRLTDAEVGQANLGTRLGFVELDGEEVYVERLETTKREAWMKTKVGDLGDLRLLGNHKDAAGARHLPLATALGLMRETKFDEWTLLGPRVVKEYLKAIREGPGDLISYHSQWARRSGVSEYAAVVHDHRILTEAFRLAITVDQLDVSNLLSFEHLARRLVQHETAVSRCPSHPDYSGLEVVMQAPTSATGQATTTAFNEYITTKLKDQANILKQTRLWKEEQKGSSSGGGHGGGGGKEPYKAPDGKGGGDKPKKKAKGAPKGGTPGGGGGAGAAEP